MKQPEMHQDLPARERNKFTLDDRKNCTNIYKLSTKVYEVTLTRG